MRRHHSGDSRDAGAGCCCLSAAAAADDDEAAAAAMLSSSIWYEACTSSLCCKRTHARTHTHPFNDPFSGTSQVSRYQKGKTNLDFTEARDSEWQRHQLGHMQVCTSLQTDNHASTLPLSSLQAGCPSCRPNQQRQSTDNIGLSLHCT